MNIRKVALTTLALFLMNGASLAESGDATKGASQWAETCARCHNMRDPTEFEARLWRPIVTHMRVRAGLRGEEARNILAFLEGSAADANRAARLVPTTAVTDAVQAPGQSGQAIYETTCIACHGADGSGVVPGTPDFTRAGNPLASKSQSDLLGNMIDGFQSEGSPMAMPPKGGNPSLTERDMRVVLEYLMSRHGR